MGEVSLIECELCGEPRSDKTGSHCPNCGKQLDSDLRGMSFWLIGGVIGLVGGLAVWWFLW